MGYIRKSRNRYTATSRTLLPPFSCIVYIAHHRVWAGLPSFSVCWQQASRPTPLNARVRSGPEVLGKACLAHHSNLPSITAFRTRHPDLLPEPWAARPEANGGPGAVLNAQNAERVGSESASDTLRHHRRDQLRAASCALAIERRSSQASSAIAV